MNKKGEIIIVDDDEDDCEIFVESLQRLDVPNKVVCFKSVQETLCYLRKVDSDPFLIISDLRMPGINGLEFRQMIYADMNLVKKAIPFILFTLTIDRISFNTALVVGVQGFFVKPISLQEMDETLSLIINYFQKSFGNSVQ